MPGIWPCAISIANLIAIATETAERAIPRPIRPWWIRLVTAAHAVAAISSPANGLISIMNKNWSGGMFGPPVAAIPARPAAKAANNDMHTALARRTRFT